MARAGGVAPRSAVHRSQSTLDTNMLRSVRLSAGLTAGWVYNVRPKQVRQGKDRGCLSGEAARPRHNVVGCAPGLSGSLTARTMNRNGANVNSLCLQKKLRLACFLLSLTWKNT